VAHVLRFQMFSPVLKVYTHLYLLTRDVRQDSQSYCHVQRHSTMAIRLTIMAMLLRAVFVGYLRFTS